MDLSLLLHNDVFTGVLGGSLVAGGLFALKSVPAAIGDLISWRFTSELRVFNEDAAFEVVSEWLASLDFAKRARRLRLTSVWSDEASGEVTQCSPGLGKHLVWYKKHPVLVERYLPDKSVGGASYKRREDISIRTFGHSPDLLHELVEQIMMARSSANQKQVEVFMFNAGWRVACRKDKRALASVVMPAAQRDSIIADIEQFLRSRSWYAKRGIPYRRGMLFYGPAGCGKTSLVMALASHFGRRIYALNLGSIAGDEQLIEAITGVPESAILLIEDIDAAQANRAAVAAKAPVAPGEHPAPEAPQGISLSALLNAIDGVFSRDGRILIMTTNHPEKIDPALLRPGRADRKEEIGPLGAREALEMAEQFMGDLGFGAVAGLKLPITPAELQRHLLAERESVESYEKAAE